jgi:hypothetical protein
VVLPCGVDADIAHPRVLRTRPLLQNCSIARVVAQL